MLFAGQTFPYVRKTHNQIDSVGHMALLLTYAASLILRNENNEASASETFPVEGYGWFIVLVYMVILPAPTIYSLCVHGKEEVALWEAEVAAAEGHGTAAVMNFDANPLTQTTETEAREERDFDSPSNVGAHVPADSVSLARLAKLQRQQRAAEKEIGTLRAQIVALQADNSAKS